MATSDQLIRCLNWEDSDVCGVDCGIVWPAPAQDAGIPWNRWVHNAGWVTLESGRIVDGIAHNHCKPFCSLECLHAWSLSELMDEMVESILDAS